MSSVRRISVCCRARSRLRAVLEVKNLGDGLMVAFTSLGRALASAVGMQQSIERHNHREVGAALSVRIGMSTGEATEEDGDYFGDPASGSSAPAPVAAAWHAFRLLPDALASCAAARVTRWPASRVQKEGVSMEHPLRPYRFFAAFFLPPAAFFAAFFAISPPGAVAAQRAHRYRVVTTGGLSGPPSYKM